MVAGSTGLAAVLPVMEQGVNSRGRGLHVVSRDEQCGAFHDTIHAHCHWMCFNTAETPPGRHSLVWLVP